MPLAFPSHQGLIAPLWQRFPDHFNVLALYVGAGIPDAVDGLAGPFKGSLGQWYGHTLLGSFVLCIPLGLAVTWLCLRTGRLMAATRWGRWAGNGIVSAYAFPQGLSPMRRAWMLLSSVWIGALTHDAIDAVSHQRTLFLYPWRKSLTLFPQWWSREWFTIPVPGYRDPYSVGPHLVAWLVLGILGIVMFLGSVGLTDRPRSGTTKPDAR